MRKIFDPSDKGSSGISLEALHSAYQLQRGISTESLSTFVGKLRDRLSGAVGVLTLTKDDKIFQVVLSRKHELRAKIKELDFTLFRENLTVKPMNFQGRYVPYIERLSKHVIDEKFLDHVLTHLKHVDGTVAAIINSEKTGGTRIPTTLKKLAQDSEKLCATITTSLSPFQHQDTGATRTNFKELLNGWNDVPVIIDYMEKFNRGFNFEQVKQVSDVSERTSETISEMFSLLERGYLSENFGSNSSEAARERKIVQEVIWSAALLVEMTSFLYTSMFNLTGALKVNIDDILKY